MNAFRPVILTPILLASAASLAACATAPDDSYPSLGIREAEYDFGQLPRPTGDCIADGVPVSGQFEPAAPPPPPPPPPTMSTDMIERIAQLEQQARAAHADFERAVPDTRAAVRGRGPVGSKSWGRAETAYANLRSIRAQTAIPFGELEMLLATRATAGEPIDAIVAARDVVIALIEQEDTVLAELAPGS